MLLHSTVSLGSRKLLFGVGYVLAKGFELLFGEQSCHVATEFGFLRGEVSPASLEVCHRVSFVEERSALLVPGFGPVIHLGVSVGFTEGVFQVNSTSLTVNTFDQLDDKSEESA